MFNDIFIHKGEVWAKVKYSCKLPLVGFVKPDVPVRMSEENFKILRRNGHPVVKIPVSELYVMPLGKYYNPAPLVQQIVDKEFRVDHIDKLPVIEERVEEPTIESVMPDNCIADISSVGDMLVQQALIEEEPDDVIDEDDEPITRNEVNRMKKADLQKLLDYLEIPYTEEMVVKDLRELALEALDL